MSQPSAKQLIEERARELVSPIAAAEGVELIDVEYLREQGGWILRLFIDKGGGVGLEDCAAVSRAVDAALDVEDLVPQEYHLEVSSPGLNRPLTKPDHYRRVVGQKIRVKTFAPVGEPGRKNFLGILSALRPDGVTVTVEGAGAFDLAYKDIAKANLEFEA